MSDRIPEKIQTMRAWPTLPLFLSTPLGETKIPAPTMMPTMIATPSHRPSSFFSLTPSPSLLGAAASARRTGFSAGATLSGIFRASRDLRPFSKSEQARAGARARTSRVFARDDSEYSDDGVPHGHYREHAQTWWHVGEEEGKRTLRKINGRRTGRRFGRKRERGRVRARSCITTWQGAFRATGAHVQLTCRAAAIVELSLVTSSFALTGNGTFTTVSYPLTTSWFVARRSNWRDASGGHARTHARPLARTCALRNFAGAHRHGLRNPRQLPRSLPSRLLTKNRKHTRKERPKFCYVDTSPSSPSLSLTMNNFEAIAKLMIAPEIHFPRTWFLVA